MAIEIERSGYPQTESQEVPNIRAVPGLEDIPQGESASAIQPHHIIEHLVRVDQAMGNITFLRRVADFESTEGVKHRAGLDKVELEPHHNPGEFSAYLRSHKKAIVITGAAVLFAAGVGVRLQRNRTQRKKMKRGL